MLLATTQDLCSYCSISKLPGTVSAQFSKLCIGTKENLSLRAQLQMERLGGSQTNPKCVRQTRIILSLKWVITLLITAAEPWRRMGGAYPGHQIIYL